MCFLVLKELKFDIKKYFIGRIELFFNNHNNSWKEFVLTLIRLKSERPCLDGGGLWEPPLLSWLWSKFLLKNHVSLKDGINSNSFGHFLEFFFKIAKKIGENWKSIKKWLNMSEISKFCNFWAISTCNTEFAMLWKRFEIKFYVKNTFFRGIESCNSSKITKFRNFTHN